MKKYIIAFLIAITSVTFAQALTEQFYTLKSVNKGTYLGSDFVGYLAPEFNDQCGADAATPGKMGSPACAVMKAKVQPGVIGTTEAYYRIVQANHGTEIANFVGWMENNKVCGLPASTSDLMGAKGCALIHASPYGSENVEDVVGAGTNITSE